MSTTLIGSTTHITRGTRMLRSLRTACSNVGELGARRLPRDADGVAERANGLRRHAATTQAGKRRHARIVPAAHVSLVHETQQLPLAHDRVVELQARELDLRGRILEPRLAHEPFVDVAIVLELERAERARDAFDGVAQSVREVIQRIDAPLVAKPVM